jgi:hypothetical protein
MRFENNVQHLKSSVSGADDADHGTGLPRSSAVSLGVAGKTGLQQKRLVPNACPHVVAAALSWLLAQVLCGFPGYREAMNSALFTRVADYSETSPTSTPPPPRLPRAHRNSTSLDRHLARRSCGGGAARSHPRLSLGGGGFAGTRHQVCDSDVGILGRLDAERHRHSPRANRARR